ncbi:hypothetical protein [Tropicibacter sp. S64]|uniref:hypothetical protein n=1 Tax=Tropicibacter sp. S64 TaxID=3415122 RepID=UPI003C7BEE35
MTEEQIITVGEAYAAHASVKLTTLGVYAANDGKFFASLREGRECRRLTRQKVSKWFSENWPEDLEWPQDIPRPDTSPKQRKGAA